jgi:putative NADPH-quinone reductase
LLRGTPPDLVQRLQKERLQKDLAWCERLLLLYPLGLGSMPGKLKLLLEQALRPGLAFGPAAGKKGFPPRLLKGRSARIRRGDGDAWLLHSAGSIAVTA